MLTHNVNMTAAIVTVSQYGNHRAMLQLSRLASLYWTPGSNPDESMVYKKNAEATVPPTFSSAFPAIIIPPLLHTHISATRWGVLQPQPRSTLSQPRDINLGASSLTRHLARYRVSKFTVALRLEEMSYCRILQAGSGHQKEKNSYELLSR